MSALDLSLLRDAVVATLRTKIPGVKSIEAHGGTFDEKEIKRYATLAPAIRVAVTGVGQVARHATGQLKIPVHFAAVVITKDAASEGSGKVSRDVTALLLSNAVALAVYGNRFGLEGVYQPEDVRGRNEYSGLLDTTGVALWQVTWTTPALVGESVDEAIAALAELWVNQVLIADPEPTGADPLTDPIVTGAP